MILLCARRAALKRAGTWKYVFASLPPTPSRTIFSFTSSLSRFIRSFIFSRFSMSPTFSLSLLCLFSLSLFPLAFPLISLSFAVLTISLVLNHATALTVHRVDLDFILDTEDDESDPSADTVNPTAAASEHGTTDTTLDTDASSVSAGAGAGVGVGVGSGAETGAPLVYRNDGDEGPVVEASSRQADVLGQSADEGAAVETSVGQYVNVVGWAKQVYYFYSQILTLKGLSIGSPSLAYSL